MRWFGVIVQVGQGLADIPSKPRGLLARPPPMMNAVSSPEMIDVSDLKVGMFVHLDLSWMQHPFPLSSFKIASDAQIATIRTLGLKRVRWSHKQSDSIAAAPTEPAAPAALVTQPLPTRAAVSGGGAPSESPEAQARELRRRQLADQRAALQHCERQFAEAAQGVRLVTDLVPTQPAAARLHAEQLSHALVDKMLGEQELCIRLLTDAAGDKASAHALNVSIISLLMGRSLGLEASDMMDLGVGALLHDIGKLELPDRVRHREDHFSAAEARFYEEHVALGVAQGRKMGLSSGALLVLAQHHEHADGTGFPQHLNTDRMTAAARIVALVNRYDNLCNPHVSTRALTPHEALSLLFAQGKSKFDTAVLGAFIRMMGVYPAGSAVQLTDDRFAVVVAVNSSRPLKPRVLVHDAGVPRDEAVQVDLESVAGLGIRRSLRPAQLPVPTLEYLSPRPRIAYYFEPAEAARSA
jgi:putative nucleotidyltransferase with HDIG domain